MVGIYLISALASKMFVVDGFRFTPFFIPAGVMFWWFMTYGTSGIATAIIARFLTDFVVYPGARQQVTTTVVNAVIVLATVFVGAQLTARKTHKLERLRETGWFIGFGCVFTPALTAVSVSVADVVRGAQAADIRTGLQSFFIGDALAIATIVPVFAYVTGLWSPLLSSRLNGQQSIQAYAEGVLQALSIALFPLIVFGLGTPNDASTHAWIPLAVLPCLWVALRRTSLAAHIASLSTIIGLSLGARFRLNDATSFVQVQAVMLAGAFATLYAVGVSRAQRRQAVEELNLTKQRFARDRVDQITGLLNRTGIVEEIERMPQHCTVICLAIDRFETLSDGITNDQIDHVVNEVATRILAHANNALVGRIETNALAVVFVRQEYGDVVAAAQRMVNSISAQRMLTQQPHNLRLPVTASAGIATSLQPGDQAEDLLRHAQIAVRHSIGSGGNQVCMFDQSWRREAESRHRMVSDLRDALDADDQLFLDIQPLVRIADGQIVGGEALIRWRPSPQAKVVMPGEFVPLAETSGLIGELGDRAFRLAAKHLAEWQPIINRTAHLTHTDFLLHVNVSPRQLENPDLAELLRSHCISAGVDPKQICVELVETTLSTDPEYASKILQTLRDVGFHLALDDFGTGFSTVSWLSRFPIDTLKIDRVFVQGLPDRIDDLAIVELIINLAKQLGLSVSAEGIETEQQVESLRALGCEFGQGYFFARPISPAEFGARLVAQAESTPHELQTNPVGRNES